MGDPIGEHRGHDGTSPGPAAVAGRGRGWGDRLLTAGAVVSCMTVVVVACAIVAGEGG